MGAFLETFPPPSLPQALTTHTATLPDSLAWMLPRVALGSYRILNELGKARPDLVHLALGPTILGAVVAIVAGLYTNGDLEGPRGGSGSSK